MMDVIPISGERKESGWRQRHLLGLEDLSQEELLILMQTAEGYADFSQHQGKKRTDLAGQVVVNLFFEPSTRTRVSFGLAARRLGADTVDFSASGSSLSKGETF